MTEVEIDNHNTANAASNDTDIAAAILKPILK